MAVPLPNAEVALYARTLANSFARGTRILDTLDEISASAGSGDLQIAVTKVRDGLLLGRPIYLSMKDSGVFPDSVVSKVEGGELTGMLDLTFAELADFYEV